MDEMHLNHAIHPLDEKFRTKQAKSMPDFGVFCAITCMVDVLAAQNKNHIGAHHACGALLGKPGGSPKLGGHARMPPMTTAAFRIGEGWDTHALVTGRPLVLGGVDIPHSHGLAGHSDADALLHAITDALLGAAALGDIGQHFPDTDARFKGADSMVLLSEAYQRVQAAGWQLVNLDATIVAQAPKMAPHIPAMRARIAQGLQVATGQVNVKAKTAERMGPVGEGRAIEARAICLLKGLDAA